MPKSLHSPSLNKLLSLLRELRAEAGLSQQALAEKLERTQSFVTKVETGERKLEVLEFVAWCRALKASPSAIIEKVEHYRSQ